MERLSLLKMLGSGDLSSDDIEQEIALCGGYATIDLLQASESDDPDIRKGIAILLPRIPEIDGTEIMIRTLLEDPDCHVVAELLWSLEGKSHLAAAHVHSILAFCRSTEWNLRLAAVTLLGDLMEDGRLPSEVSTDELLLELTSDTTAAVRKESVRLLLGSGMRTSLEILARLCSDEEAGVRQAAIEALGERKLRWGFLSELIRQLLHDEAYDVRIAACQAARRYPRDAVALLPLLSTMAESSDAELRKAALRTQEAIVSHIGKRVGKASGTRRAE